MTRLIEADKFIERMKPYIEKYGAKEFPYNIVHDAFVYEVEQEPTVNAIPIEYIQYWIDKQNYGRRNGKMMLAKALNELITEWRKEHDQIDK